MWNEFKGFILKANILELATAVIVATAFGGVVTSFTNDIILPPFGLLLGGVDFSELAITLKTAELDNNGGIIKEAVQLKYGSFIQSIINFLIIASAIFMVLKAYENTRKKEEAAPAAPTGPSTEELLTQIRDLLKK